MTQTLTEYLVESGAPPLPKDWKYHVAYKQESKIIPASDRSPEREQVTVHFEVWIADQNETVLGRGKDFVSLTYSEALGGSCISKAANRAYHSLYRKSDIDYKTVLSYF